MSNIKSNEAKAARLTNSVAHAERLLAALGGSPIGWEWLGQLRSSERPALTCACGHSGCCVLYGLERAGTKAIVWVGSSCINSYAEANPVLVERIKGHVAQLQAEARAARAAIREQVVAAEGEAMVERLRVLSAEAAAIFSAERARACGDGYRRVAYAVWYVSSYGFARSIYASYLTSYEGLRQHLALTRQSAVIARLKKAIEFAEAKIAAARAAMGRDE